MAEDTPPDPAGTPITISEVVSDPPAPAPTYVVDDSKLKASLVTIFSLVFFGITLAGAILRLAAAHDLNAIRALLMRDDTLTFFTTVAPFAWLAYRTIMSWIKKRKSIAIAVTSPVTALKSEIKAAAAVDPAPAPRAPEATTRLVNANALAAAQDPEWPVPQQPAQPVDTSPKIPGDALSPPADKGGL
jgi:hypothetical protein